MYGELEEMFEDEEVQEQAKKDRHILETVQVYVAKMLKDKNQNNYQRSRPMIIRLEVHIGIIDQLRGDQGHVALHPAQSVR